MLPWPCFSLVHCCFCQTLSSSRHSQPLACIDSFCPQAFQSADISFQDTKVDSFGLQRPWRHMRCVDSDLTSIWHERLCSLYTFEYGVLTRERCCVLMWTGRDTVSKCLHWVPYVGAPPYTMYAKLWARRGGHVYVCYHPSSLPVTCKASEPLPD